MKYTGFGFLFLLILSGCFGGKPLSKRLFYDKAILDIAFENPELISFVEPPLVDRFWHYKARLTDVSPEKEAEFLKEMTQKRKIMESYKTRNLKGQKRLSYDILYWYLAHETRDNAFLYYDYPVNQLSGIQSETPGLMITTHSVKNMRDVKSYLTRLAAFDLKFTQTIAGMEKRRTMNIIPPKFVLEKVIAQMEGFVAIPVKEHPLYTSLKTKMNKSGITGKKQVSALEKTEATLQNQVFPAYQKLITYCRELLPEATTDDGVWKFPNGKAFYAHILKTHTTSNLTPDEVHTMGLKEVEKLETEAKAVLERLGMKSKSVGEYLSDLAKDPRFLYPDTEEGRIACLAQYQALIDDIYKIIPTVFDVEPKSRVEVKRVPEFKEKTAPGAYYEPPSLGGKRPGIFYANLRSLKEIPKWSMATLAYHEAVPGHHFQVAIQQNLKGLPIYRRVIPFTAYLEGWALYAEHLAVEMKAHKDDYSLLGYYQAQLFRAVRLVVDTGIHDKKWTREQAIQYMLEHTGMPEGDVIAEIERYIVDPGQACAYKTGQLKILELRQKARTEMGEKFSIKTFHRILLNNGAMPLEIMEKVIEDYIQEGK